MWKKLQYTAYYTQLLCMSKQLLQYWAAMQASYPQTGKLFVRLSKDKDVKLIKAPLLSFKISVILSNQKNPGN